MFESLTNLLDKMPRVPYGTWQVDRENEGTPERPVQLPFVMYGPVAEELMNAVYQFVDEYMEWELTRYSDILEKSHIEWGTESMAQADVTTLDGRTVMALLVGAIRADRFCEGALLDFFENGSIQRWLERLREIDNQSAIAVNDREVSGTAKA